MKGQLNILERLDDLKTFIPGLLGSVHQDCSPWTGEEIEAAYQKSSRPHKPGTSLPIEYSQLNGKRQSYLTDCNICLKHFKNEDLIMVIPVTCQEFATTAKKKRLQQGIAECQCPDILNGHCNTCDFAP